MQEYIDHITATRLCNTIISIFIKMSPPSGSYLSKVPEAQHFGKKVRSTDIKCHGHGI